MVWSPSVLRSRTMKHGVIISSIDGLAAFYWRDGQVRLPVLRRLAEQGVIAAGMGAGFPTTTWGGAGAGARLSARAPRRYCLGARNLAMNRRQEVVL